MLAPPITTNIEKVLTLVPNRLTSWPYVSKLQPRTALFPQRCNSLQPLNSTLHSMFFVVLEVPAAASVIKMTRNRLEGEVRRGHGLMSSTVDVDG